jgi:hypothetical protein
MAIFLKTFIRSVSFFIVLRSIFLYRVAVFMAQRILALLARVLAAISSSVGARAFLSRLRSGVWALP